MNISETYIRRPIATSLMMLGLLVFGSATLPGASPETMASWVATPLEQQFAPFPASPR